MDPGNWATDLAAGSAYGYSLLSVILLSNLMAVLLQSLCIKLGVATGRDLAQACRDHFSRRVSFALWVLCEVAAGGHTQDRKSTRLNSSHSQISYAVFC